MAINNRCPFTVGESVIDTLNPAHIGIVTGRTSMAGPITMVEVMYPDGSTPYIPSDQLTVMQRQPTLVERLTGGMFGRAQDLRRTITYEKLKGTLQEVVYSMEAAQIDFYPYQFKPVLKIINAPTERLILADEVGLGKTIESALIWLELQARKQAKRLLVVCPKSLAEKWKEELRWKFQLDARIVDFKGLKDEIAQLPRRGRHHAFTLIATYTSLRPPRGELSLLNEPPANGSTGSPKTEFLRELAHNEYDYEPFDLVIFDEAHYMRHQATTNFRLGECLSSCADAVLCVSATPVNNSNTDLHSLLRLIDENFFESQALFNELLEANRPAVRASSTLARVPMNRDSLTNAIEQMANSQFISNTPLFLRLKELVQNLNPANKAEVAKCQDVAERLNLLGGYINRTRRVQVDELRAVREPLILEVEYTPDEMHLYNTIRQLVRMRCQEDNRPIHVFQVMGLQLRAASCLPVLAKEIQEGRFGDMTELLTEAYGEDACDTLLGAGDEDRLISHELSALIDYDFERHDTKYAKLKYLVNDLINNEKIIIFAYYRPTLAYLHRRLTSDNLSVIEIHGGIPAEERWQRLERFSEPNGPRILLSSEVGSEGIDLQFCRVVVNYDLPWNPMRVEQRIGRIDRVGQKADRLAIVNFKVRNTIEERLYERLHTKLELFRNSMGDLEEIIGKEVQQLTIDLLSRDLTPEQEEARIERTEAVIQERLLALQQLEESGDTLIAFSDYLQRQINELRGKGRFMQPEELEDYVCDFFNREFRGTLISHDIPTIGCLRFELSTEALYDLRGFLGNDTSPSAFTFHQRSFTITFRREVMQQLSTHERREVHFTNHLSPFIRWITKKNQENVHVLYNVSALLLADTLIPHGIYCYIIDRWKIEGFTKQERLAYAIISLETLTRVQDDLTESITQHLLHEGKDWLEARIPSEILEDAYRELESHLENTFSTAVTDFIAENSTVIQIKKQRILNYFDRRIEQTEASLETLRRNHPGSNMIQLTEARLSRAQENKQQKIETLNRQMHVSPKREPVAAGVFRVV